MHIVRVHFDKKKKKRFRMKCEEQMTRVSQTSSWETVQKTDQEKSWT